MRKVILFSVLILSLACYANATPIFNGDTFADFGIGDAGLPTNAQGPGYYIWTNNADRTSWSVRWTGMDWTTNVDHKYQWSGNIIFSNSDGIQEANKVSWDSNDGVLNVYNGIGSDVITFGTANAGPYWDGFDFSLTGVTGDYLTFSLDSTYFTLDNDGIYIGQNMVSVLDNCDSPEFFISSSGTNRQFEASAPVPEPATMVLMGIGLVGLAGASRKKLLQKKM